MTTARISTPGGIVDYRGDTAIAGVPGRAAAIDLAFADTAGSTCGALLPTGNAVDLVDGLRVTAIDNGMPTIVLSAAELGLDGDESPADLEANAALRARLEKVRLALGPRMGLGDVTQLTIPKLSIVSAPGKGGTLCTRTFIPHRCHDAIGVLGAVSVATAALLDDGPARAVAASVGTGEPIVLEHPTGDFAVLVDLVDGEVRRAAVLRTARKLFDGLVFPREGL